MINNGKRNIFLGILSILVVFAVSNECFSSSLINIEYWDSNTDYGLNIREIEDYQGLIVPWSNVIVDVEDLDYSVLSIGYAYQYDQWVFNGRFSFGEENGNAEVKWFEEGILQSSIYDFDLDEYRFELMCGYSFVKKGLYFTPYLGARWILDEIPIVKERGNVLIIHEESIDSLIQLGVGSTLGYATRIGLNADIGGALYGLSTRGKGYSGSFEAGLSYILKFGGHIRLGYKYEKLDIDDDAFKESSRVKIKQDVEQTSNGILLSFGYVW